MLLPLLTRQKLDVTFFVVEQTEPDLFNRAALLNIGYLEALKVAPFDCFIFHDVDLVPLNDNNLYMCLDQPHQMAVSIQFSKWIPASVMPSHYVSGVTAFTRLQYELINGNSNLYFGGDTNDLYQRMTNKNLTNIRGDKDVATYFMLFHERMDALSLREELMKSAIRRQDVEGLNTSQYKVLEVRLERLYTWIKVSLDMTQVFRTAPAYTLQDIKTSLSEPNRDIKTSLSEQERDIKTSLSEPNRDIKTSHLEPNRDIKTSLSEQERDIKTSLSEQERDIKTSLSEQERDIKTSLSEPNRDINTSLQKNQTEI